MSRTICRKCFVYDLLPSEACPNCGGVNDKQAEFIALQDIKKDEYGWAVCSTTGNAGLEVLAVPKPTGVDPEEKV